MPVIALLLSAAAAAPAPQSTGPNPVTAITACRTIADAQARLACYDNAAGTLDQAIATKDVTVLTKSDVTRTRRSLFGFSVPKLPFLGGDDAQPPQITAKIKSVRSAGYGKFQFTLDDGALWETTDSANFGEMPEAGQSVTIKSGVLGSYFIKFEGMQTVRGHRIS